MPHTSQSPRQHSAGRPRCLPTLLCLLLLLLLSLAAVPGCVADKGLYTVSVPVSSLPANSMDLMLRYCLTGGTPGIAAQILSSADNNELHRVMSATAGGSAGTFLLGAQRTSASDLQSDFSWLNFDRSRTALSYQPTGGIDDPHTLANSFLTATPATQAWTVEVQASVTHVVCQPPGIEPATGTLTIVAFDPSETPGYIAPAYDVSVDPLEAIKCDFGATPMNVRTPQEELLLEWTIMRDGFGDAATHVLPRMESVRVFINAVFTMSEWRWGDGSAVDFSAIWTVAPSMADEGARLWVVAAGFGWAQGNARPNPSYVACYTPPADTGGNGGGNAGGNTNNNDGGDDKKGGGLPWWVYLIIGIAAGAVVIAVVLTIVLCCCGCCGCCPCAPDKGDDRERSNDRGAAAGNDYDADDLDDNYSPAASPSLARGRSSRRSLGAADTSMSRKPSRTASSMNGGGRGGPPGSRRTSVHPAGGGGGGGNGGGSRNQSGSSPSPSSFRQPPGGAAPYPQSPAPATPQPNQYGGYDYDAYGGGYPAEAANNNNNNYYNNNNYSGNNNNNNAGYGGYGGNPYGGGGAAPQPPPPANSYGGYGNPNPYYPPAPPAASPSPQSQSPAATLAEDDSSGQKRLGRRNSVKFVPAQHNQYAGTPGELPRVPSARARQANDADLAMEL